MAATVTALDQVSRRPVNDSDSASVREAAKSSKLEALVALRDRIADTLDGPIAARDMASNSKRLMEIIDEIDAEEARLAEEAKQDRSKSGNGSVEFDPSSVT